MDPDGERKAPPTQAAARNAFIAKVMAGLSPIADGKSIGVRGAIFWPACINLKVVILEKIKLIGTGRVTDPARNPFARTAGSQPPELAALNLAIHRTGQKQLPGIFFGAGLPQLAGLSGEALRRFDDGFFQVRFDRSIPMEREYVIAMSELGKGSYRSSEVAGHLGERLGKPGPRRVQIIAKEMIYSPQYGNIEFTVPMLDDYLRRSREGKE